MFIAVELGIALLVQHSGDIEHFVSIALRGCSLSGDSARRNSGEDGSVLFGRANVDFFALDIVEAPELELFELQLVTFEAPDELFKLVLLGNAAHPGLYDCVVFDAPMFN